MRKLILIFGLLLLLTVPANAMEYKAPAVPQSGQALLEDEPTSFTEGLLTIVKRGVGLVAPALTDAAAVCMSVIAIAVLLGIIKTLPGASEQVIALVGTVSISVTVLHASDALIWLGVDTVTELSEYGKLLLPVMTAAYAAQGGITASAALYTGTVAFDALLSSLIGKYIVPLLYIHMCLSVAASALGNELLAKLQGFIKWIITWCLKLILYFFTGYMAITGVVSGATDVAALKATKLTIAGVVPVVGGILSDASETVLVSAGIMKNAVGVYGLLAVIALWLGPFIRIGAQYLMLKLTGSICTTFYEGRTTKLVHDFSGTMGMLLAMTGTMCMLLLVSIVCFMKGSW